MVAQIADKGRGVEPAHEREEVPLVLRDIAEEAVAEIFKVFDEKSSVDAHVLRVGGQRYFASGEQDFFAVGLDGKPGGLPGFFFARLALYQAHCLADDIPADEQFALF